ncbi:glycoside hydrolase family 130 protein [Novosphingobium album (ex Liu et al. 2023)]|uniref:Glycoside hydrolase family 130 protein n=1 Tax=Novosphingobium album (ex Liu et al. 2023) TaxID=3031130 RepID=A0ABT5WU70_9SPHN|nr:glycoside hydrolase family 130 protein [Novosphingobium album (ex Liu et al. 2023)]MDE8653434.1 glycoside hydrolase family 130 protein [Novosphingobium album (ex Liu et al. 2023)]
MPIFRRLPQRLNPDPSRVVIRPFQLSWQAEGLAVSRAERLVEDVLGMDETTAEAGLAAVLNDFKCRHWQIERVFRSRFAQIFAELGLDAGSISDPKKLLIGAYFCHEYSFAAAALMNPSVVPHPDQSGLDSQSIRIILSLRAVGEGHISSIAFCEGIVGADSSLELVGRPPFATSAILAEGPDNFARVIVERDRDSTLSETVIFPVTPAQANGLEDLRLTTFVHEDGSTEWIGTYTAYSGSAIRSELMRTRDFKRFCLQPMQGSAVLNKGMALFPRMVDGRYRMIGRQDGKNLFLLESDDLTVWAGGVLILEPKFPWEFIQIGNCGPPIETDDGWLLLTHGVGPMRKYALGATLLDKDNPAKVLARTAEPLLAAADHEREGYVPNVVYTCGALRVNNTIFLPYGLADSSVAFAFADLDDIIALMS